MKFGPGVILKTVKCVVDWVIEGVVYMSCTFSV